MLEWRKQLPGVHSSAESIDELQIQPENLSQTIAWAAVEEAPDDDLWLPHVHTHMCTHLQGHVPFHEQSLSEELEIPEYYVVSLQKENASVGSIFQPHAL